MRNELVFSRLWSDEDCIELGIVASDSRSSFANSVYVAHDGLAALARQLEEFRLQVNGATDIRMGTFGPEYGGGAFHARFQFHDPGRLFISAHQQDQFAPFPNNRAANEAKLHLVSEPVLFDRFVHELQGLAEDARGDARLECPLTPWS